MTTVQIHWPHEVLVRFPALGGILVLSLLLFSLLASSSEAGIANPQGYRGWEAAPRRPGDAVERREDEGSSWQDIAVSGQVTNQLRRFTGRGRESLLRAFRNAEVYLEQIKRLFEQAGLPAELSYLAVLESGFDPFACSRSGAVGIWQFTQATARLLGLEMDWWVDERRDPEKSSVAAARYLRRLHCQFGSWPLAVAAYNAGESRVIKAMRGRPAADIWALRLPLETRRLLSAFVALTMIAKEPAAYAFPALLEDSPSYAKVVVESCTDVTVIARACGTSPEEILNLNPELKQGCTPPHREAYELRIPLWAFDCFEEALSGIPPSERVIWLRHRVRRGDTLAGIARLYRVPKLMIAQMNDLHPPYTLKVGGDLCLPIPQGFSRWAREHAVRRLRYPGGKRI